MNAKGPESHYSGIARPIVRFAGASYALRMSRPSLSGELVSSPPRWLAPGRLTQPWGYVFGFAAVAVTIVLRALFEVWLSDRAPTYMVFLAPIVVTSVVAGLRPAILVWLVSWVTAFYVFVDPTFTFKGSATDLCISGIFGVEGLALAYLGGTARVSLDKLVARDAQLAASDTRLRIAQEAARIGTYEWEPVTGRAVWSDNVEEILGLAPGSFGGTYADAVRHIHPDDAPLIEAGAETLIATGENRMEYRVIGADGGIRWIEANGTALKRPDGSIELIVGVMVDITARRRASERTLFLARATAELGMSLDYEPALVHVTEAAVEGFSDIAVAFLQATRRSPEKIVSALHNDSDAPDLLDGLEEIVQTAENTVIGSLVRSGQPAFVASFGPAQFESAAVSAEHLAILRRINPSSLICVPLITHGASLGSLVFANRNGLKFTQEDFEVANELGRRAAFAIENAQLLDQSFEREAEISRANESLQLLADSGTELAQSLDILETVERLAHLVVPRFADACTISLDDEGKLQRVAHASATTELEQALNAIPADPASDKELTLQAAQVLQSGRPIFFPRLPDELLSRLAENPDRAGALEAIAPKSLIIMPMTVRGHTIGVMSFLRTGNSPNFDREDLSLAGQLSRRTAIAADNARLYTEARRANDAKDEFLGMMSHELRTPITVIRGGARVLRSRASHLDDETRESLLNDIERESERLSRMLENLLALARAELDREVILEPVLLHRLLPRLLDAQGAGAGRQVTFATEGELPAVAAEPGYIEHIVRNLVGNAMKYSPPDAPIDVVVAGCEDGATIRVLDRGFGIANDEASKIFERFYRSDRTSRLAGGAGLGLAVCKRLVEAMSGEIWARPRDGGGLEVGFSLPSYQEEIDV